MGIMQHPFKVVIFMTAILVAVIQADAAMDPGDIVVLGAQGSGNTLAFAGDGTNLNQLGSDSVNWGTGQTRVAFDPSTGQMIFGANNGRLYRYDFDSGSLVFSQVGSSSSIVYSSVANGIQDVAVMADGSIIVLGVSSSTGKTFAFAGQASDLNQQGSAFLDWGIGTTSVAYDGKNDELIFGSNNGRLFRYSYDKVNDLFSQVGSSSSIVYGNSIQDLTVMADGTIIVLGVSPSTGKTFAFAAQEGNLNQQGSAFLDWGVGASSVAYDAVNDELIFGNSAGRLYRYTYDKVNDLFTQVGGASSTVYSATNGIQGIAVAPIVPEPTAGMITLASIAGLMVLGRKRV